MAEFLTPETVRRRRAAMISAAGAGSLRHAHVSTVAIRDEAVRPVRFLVTLQTADQGRETVGTPASSPPR